MLFVLLVEVTLAFIVACADAVVEEAPRTRGQQLARALCWPATLWVWFTRRNLAKLARFGGVVWLFVTGGWLLSFERDRFHATWAFLVVAELTMAFVVYCVDAMSGELRAKHVRRLGRSIFWPKALAGYLRDRDSIKLVQATVTVWILLTSGWLMGLELDRIARPFGWLG